MLAAKRWLEDAPDEELLADLRRLYHTNPVCQLEVRYTGELLHDMLASRRASTSPPRMFGAE